LQFYIFEDDSLGRLLRDLLIDKAREGVKVRLLYDDVGCWKVNPLFYDQMLCEGIEVQSFLKVRFPRFASKMNYRNHRKIAIIDGKVGFIGGMNIAERYLRGLSWGIWRDTHVRIKGKAVYGLQTSFLTDWYFVDRMLFTSAEYFPKMEWQGNVLAQIVTSDPVGGWHDMMQGLVKALCCAKRYFYIETPYLLPTEEVIMGLQTAALAGVDVRIMLPKRADTFIIHKGSLSYLDELMRAGVKVYLYRKGFLHSKLWVSDDEWASVGSTNMDFRSFEHNFEANAFFYDKDMALHLKEIFLTDQKKCLLLSRKLWSKRSWSNKILESIVRLLAPLL
jgi:cardiolipin synthase